MMMFFPFITAACRKRCCRNEALLTQFWSRSSYFHGIGFSQRPSSRLPVHDDVFAIHHRSVSKTVLSIRTALTQFWSRPSYLHGIGFSQVPSSKLPIDDDVFAIHHRRVSKTVLSIRTFTYRILVLVVVFLWYSVLAGTTKQVTRQ